MTDYRVIRIAGRVDGYPSRLDGTYVIAYDPARPGTEPISGCYLVTTDTIREATRFTVEQVLAVYQQAHGVRADQEPNRPLTAYNVEILPGEE